MDFSTIIQYFLLFNLLILKVIIRVSLIVTNCKV